MPRPRVIALQTCFSLEPVRPRVVALGLPPDALELWFAHTLRDGFALAATGSYQPFQTVASETLSGLLYSLGRQSKLGDVPEVMESFSSLPAEKDFRPALEMLQAEGVRAFAVSNGSEASTRACLERANLLPLVEQIVSIDAVGQWKPAQAVYHFTASQAGVTPNELALVAAHGWDCHGAKRAGLSAGFVRRQEKWYSAGFEQADAIGDDLPSVCARLLAATNEL